MTVLTDFDVIDDVSKAHFIYHLSTNFISELHLHKNKNNEN